MKQSQLFYKTRRETPSDADSINASYLTRAGFVTKHMAGIYALLPLGFRVYKKIENIIREEMNVIGGQELLMNVLQPKEIWDETRRWQEMGDIFYKIVDTNKKVIGLAPTHEEQITSIVRSQVKSYKDIPLALYQIQTKFRNEPRAKSGLLRGREFIMKDLYSFHASKDDFEKYYEIVKKSYLKIFERFRLKVKIVEASGGVFSKFSHEFQVISAQGEDIIFFCDNCDFAQNKEIAEVKEGDICPKCGGVIKTEKSIEVGNIFPLNDKFSQPMKATFLNKDGKEENLIMGCYGIGLTRSLATIVEVYYDSTKNKMVWPDEIAPYKIHLLSLRKNEQADELYKEMIEKDIEVLYDDRDVSAGEKFAEADLIGIPTRIIVSDKSLKSGGAEYTNNKGEVKIIPLAQIVSRINEK